MRARTASIALGLLVAGCDLATRSCTEIGCSDGVSLELRPAMQGVVESGRYTLELATGDAQHRCTFTVPDDLPVQASLAEVDCPPQLQVSLVSATLCTEQRHDDAVSQSCVPVPDQFSLHAQLQATPRSLALQLSRDGAPLIDETLVPSYELSQPNGPDCGPTCRNANLAVELP
jgi:hypothetical protein